MGAWLSFSRATRSDRNPAWLFCKLSETGQEIKHGSTDQVLKYDNGNTSENTKFQLKSVLFL